MLKAAPRRLFPLHLAPIDSFFLLDDRPDYPMTFASNLFFTGTFQRNAFEAALDDALLLHPLLHAKIGLAKQGKMCWVSAGNDSPTIDWGEYDDPVDIVERQVIDLKVETGLRIWVRQSAGRARLILQFHHACCDGTGAHRFMGDFLAGYGIRTAATDDQQPVVANYDPQLLKARRIRLADEYVGGTALETVRRSIHQGVHVFGRRIAPLKATELPGWASQARETAKASEADVVVPDVVSYSFDKAQHKLLREASSRLGVTLNDLLLAEIFRTMCDWNRRHGSSRRERLRIMMPSDMRDKADYAMPAANMTSYNFITRGVKECDDLTALVKSIRDETARIKHEQRGRHFIDSIMSAKLVPGLLPFLLSGQRCLSTVTVSHMGDPTRRFLATFPRKNGKLVCGDVVLENMLGVSPLRPKTRAALSIVTLYRELTLNVRCDPHNMSITDSQQLLNMLVDHVASHLA